MNQGNTGGTIAFAIIVAMILLGVNENGGLEGAKQNILAFLEIFK